MQKVAYIAVTQRNKRRLLYFCRIAQQRGSRQRSKVVVHVGLWHGSRTKKIANHGYQNFIFLSHENRPVMYSFYDLLLHQKKCLNKLES